MPDPIHASDWAGQAFRVHVPTVLVLPILTSLKFCPRIHFLVLAFGQNNDGTHLSRTLLALYHLSTFKQQDNKMPYNK